ncbi:MAG: Type 1 phosphatases regulator ypi1 [Icmadophila ericetorum]|nr:Type 1 phosphatases regulator ypi1 [Icmadophila ericetorum]
MASSLAPGRRLNLSSNVTTSTTQTETRDLLISQRPLAPALTLRLRGEGAPRRGIRWAEDVIDNEGLGRKSSKVCCIYHKSTAPGESSDESSSDSDSSSADSDSDSESDPTPGGRLNQIAKQKRCEHGHSHDYHGHEHGAKGDKGDGGKKGGGKRRRSPNAYEKIPKRSGGGREDGIHTHTKGKG